MKYLLSKTLPLSGAHSRSIRKEISRRFLRTAPVFAMRCSAVALAACATFGFNPQALASSYNWVGASDANWADENWTTGGTLTVAVPGLSDTALFNNSGGGYTTISLGGGVTVGNITFDTPNVAAYTIGSGGVDNQALTLNDGGSIILTSTDGASQVVNAALTLGTDATTQTYTFTDNSPQNTLTVAGNIGGGTGGTTGTETIALNGSSASTNLISGNISNGGATALAISKSGAGTWALSGSNTYTGVTTLGAGTLQLQANSGNTPGSVSSVIGNSPELTMSGGTLQVLGNTSATIEPSAAASVPANSTTVGVQFTGSGPFTLFAGPNGGSSTGVTMTLGNLGQFGATGSAAPVFNIYGSNNYTLQLGSGNTGTGALDIYNNTKINSDTTGVTVSIPGGITVNFAAAYTLTLGGAGNFNLGPLVQSGANALTFTDNSSGTVTFNGSAVNTYTGATTVTAGTLALNFSNLGTPTNLINAGSALSLGGGGVSVLGKSSTVTAQTFASTALTAGENVISVTPGAGGSASVALGAITVTKGATLEIVDNGTLTTGTITTTSAGSTTAGAGGDLGNPGSGGNSNQSGYATYGLYDWPSTDTTAGAAGTSPYPIIGLGSLAGTTGYANTTSLAGSNVDVKANITVTANTGASLVRFNTPGSTYINDNNKYAGIGGLLVTPNMGASNTFFYGASSYFAENGAVLGNCYIWQNNPGAFFELQSNLGNDRDNTAETVNVIQAGLGTVVYNGNATSGKTAFYGQTYLNGGYSVIPNDAGLGDAGTNSQVNLNGGTIVGANVALSSGGGTGANDTFSTSPDSFSLDNGGSAKRSIVLGSNGGGISATTGVNMTVDGVVSGAAGTGSLVIGLPSTTVAVSGTTYTLAAGQLLGSGTATLGGAGSGTSVSANATPIFANGTVTLSSGANTYTGGTVLDSGILDFTTGSLGTGGIAFNGGTLQWGAGTTTDISSQVVTFNAPPVGGVNTLDTQGNNVTLANGVGNGGTGGFTKAGTGTLTMAGNSNYTGPTVISAGTLALNGGSLGNTAVTVAGSATLSATNGYIQIGSTGASLTLAQNASFSMKDGSLGSVSINSPAAGTANTVLALNGDTLSTAGLLFDVSGGITSGQATDELIANNGGITVSGVENILLNGINTSSAISSGTFNLLSVPNGTGLTTMMFNLVTTSLTFNGISYVTGLSVTGGDLLSLTLTPVSLNYYWSGGGASPASWSTAANFLTAAPLGSTAQTSAPAAADNVFETATGATGNLTQTLDGNYTVNSLTFNGSASPNGSITIGPGATSTNSLTLGAGSSFTDAVETYGAGIGLVVESGAAQDNITANVNLGASQTWEIDNASSNPLTVSGVIADGGSGYSLTKTGAGNLTLSNVETYTGGTIVTSGTLMLGTGGALASSGMLTVNGGSFDLGGNSQTVASLSGGGVSTGIITTSTGSATLTVNNAAATTYGGTITDNSATVSGAVLSLVYSGASSLTLSGSNSYTGGTTVNSGSLVAANNSALGSSASSLLLDPSSGAAMVDFTSSSPVIGSLANSGGGTSTVVLGNSSGSGSPTTLTIGGAGATTTFNGVISDQPGSKGSAIGSLTLAGGTLTLGGANTYTGLTTVTGGSLVLANASAIQDSTLDLTGGAASISTPTTLTMTGLEGSGNLSLSNGSNNAVALTVNQGSGALTYTGNLSGKGSLTFNSAGTTQIGSGSAGGASYLGTTTINDGTLIIGGTSSLTGQVYLTGANGVNGLTVQDSATVNSPNELVLASAGGSSYPGASTITVTGGTLTTAGLGAGNGTSREGVGQTINVSGTGAIVDNGFLDLYSGEGTTAGSTTVNIGNGTAVGGTLEIDYFQKTGGGGGNTTTINFNGGTLEALSSSVSFLPVLATNTVSVGHLGATINTNGFNDTVAAPLTHGGTGTDGGLTIMGGGSLTLIGVNTYNGATTINSGATLQLGDGTTGHDGTITPSSGITDNGSLIYNRFGAASSGLAITGGGSVTKLGAGTQTLTAGSNYIGTTTVSAGTLIVSGTLSATTTPSVSAGATLEVDGSVNNAATVGLNGSGASLATLQGTGSVGGINAVDGNLSPGLTAGGTPSAGTLTANGNVSLDNASIFNIRIGVHTEADYDSLAIGNSGVLSLDDTTLALSIGASVNDPTQADVGDQYIIVNGGATLAGGIGSGTDIFGNAPGGVYTSPSGFIFNVEYGYDATTNTIDSGGTDIALQLVAVPEPGTWASLIAGMGMLVAWQKTRRRSRRVS